jgi:murein DD-endopeptidase MepM/ murein hydrolase activator NlpD
VDAGERIASAGNSGNSTMPHLHFHVMDRTDPWEADVTPIFRSYL